MAAIETEPIGVTVFRDIFEHIKWAYQRLSPFLGTYKSVKC